MAVGSVESAFALLAELGAPPHLIQHHRLVVEAANELLQGLAVFREAFNTRVVLSGAAIHDVGKVVFTDEMHAAGHRHERAGAQLLRDHGCPDLARFCVTHADWDHDETPTDDLLVALADKLWKGRRVERLEHRVIRRLAACSHREFWDVYIEADAVFENVAAGGANRLSRSNRP